MTHDLRQGLWTEAANLSTILENIIVTPTKPIAAYYNFYKQHYPKLNSLKSFGQLAVVATNKEMYSKLADRGRVCIYLGPAENHAQDV